MKNQAKEVVTQFLSAVQNGDNQKLAELLHPKIEWSQPGDNQLSGTKQSAAEVFDMVGKMFDISGNTIRLNDIKSLSVNGDSVACLLNWQASKPSGETLNVDNIDVYIVREGKIVCADVYSADISAEDAFWRA